MEIRKRRLTGRGRKAKGDNYERELADYFNAALFPDSPTPVVARAPMSGSFSTVKGIGGPDLTGTPDVWVEAKRTESPRIHEALAQAKAGVCGNKIGDMPVVITRRSRVPTGESIVALTLDSFIKIYNGYLKNEGYRTAPPAITAGERECPTPHDPQ